MKAFNHWLDDAVAAGILARRDANAVRDFLATLHGGEDRGAHVNIHPETADSIFRFGPWKWSEPIRGEHFRRCSFCGSIHPDDLAAEPSWHAKWADRKYGWPHKFYVDIPNRDPGRLYVIGSTNGEQPIAQPGLEWVAVGDLTDKQRAVVERDGWGLEHTTYVQFGTHADHFGKFYTIHLNDPEISAETKTTIEQRSGLAFTFTEDGKVSWRATETLK